MKMPSMLFSKTTILLFFMSFVSIAQNDNTNPSPYLFSGRVEPIASDKAILIGSASSVRFNFSGNSCSVTLKSIDSWEHHNYVSIELDGQYIGRLKVEKGDSKSYPILVSNNNTSHQVTLFKATEAANGGILFEGATTNLLPIAKEKKKTIEFIGNSITCGMGNDTKEIPCGSGEWFDQHNAYWAYGPILSRKLDVDFLLSSVSGIGMYRNWNDEHQDEAIMPEVYENLYLNKDKSKPFTFATQPDIVSICLGTNDLSEGDGIKPRLPFNEQKFIANYIQFIQNLYQHYPNTQIVLLNSPMVSGERNTIFVKCLQEIIKHFKQNKKHKKILLFEYQPMQPKGCGYHPDIEDHKVMAAQLETFFKKILDEN